MKVHQQKTNAYTLVEVMVVLIVVAVLTAFCVPSFQRALEQSRANVATANLRAIWAAQRLHWLEHRTYAGNLGDLQAMKLLDLESTSSSRRYDYYIDTGQPPTDETFTAVADRINSDFWSGQLKINETGAITGSVTAGDGTVISPGFQ